jgi:hypothetical protein
MANLPDNFKYNPLEVDERGWIPVRSQSIVPPALKNCLPCKYAPIVLFVIVDFIISMYGLSHQSMWLCLQLLFGSFYVKSSAYQEGRYLEKTDNQTRISTIMLGLMAGITLRHIGMLYMLS